MAPEINRRIVLALALAADVDPRTASRSLREGVGVIKGAATRERLTTAANGLGIVLPVRGDKGASEP